MFHIAESLLQFFEWRYAAQPFRIQIQSCFLHLQLLFHPLGKFLFRPQQIHPFLPDLVFRTEIRQTCCLLSQSLSSHLQFAVHRQLQSPHITCEHFLPAAIIKDSKFRCRRRCRCSKIRYIISDRHIRLMTYRRNDRCGTVKNRPCHDFFVKCPKILHGSSSTADNDHIHTKLIQRFDSFHDAFCRIFSLHPGRIENNLHIWIPPGCYISDILNNRTGWCRHYTQRFDK